MLSQGEEPGQVLAHPFKTRLFVSVVLGDCQMPKRFDPELGDLEVRPSGGSLKSWDTVNVMSNASLLREKQNWGVGGAVSSKQ